MKSRGCNVYVIAHLVDGQHVAPVKIGIANNPKKRVAELQTGNPSELALVNYLSVPDRDIAKTLERAFHDTQSEHRLCGEWFDIKPLVAIQLIHLNLTAALTVKTNFSQDEIFEIVEMSCAGCLIHGYPDEFWEK